MANIKVSEMATATTFEDDDYTMIVQSNKNKKITRSNMFFSIENDISDIQSDISNIENDISNINNIKNIINIELSSNTSVSNGSTIPFDTIINSLGNKLTFDSSSHGIIIGSGINYVEVSALLAVQYSATNGAYSIVLAKNDTELTAMRAWATKDSSNVYSATIPPFLIPVQENDIITVKFKDGTATIRPETFLNVKVVD